MFIMLTLSVYLFFGYASVNLISCSYVQSNQHNPSDYTFGLEQRDDLLFPVRNNDSAIISVWTVRVMEVFMANK